MDSFSLLSLRAAKKTCALLVRARSKKMSTERFFFFPFLSWIACGGSDSMANPDPDGYPVKPPNPSQVNPQPSAPPSAFANPDPDPSGHPVKPPNPYQGNAPSAPEQFSVDEERGPKTPLVGGLDPPKEAYGTSIHSSDPPPDLTLSKWKAFDADPGSKCCRFCFSESSQRDMIAPCLCAGSSKWVHRSCLESVCFPLYPLSLLPTCPFPPLPLLSPFHSSLSSGDQRD